MLQFATVVKVTIVSYKCNKPFITIVIFLIFVTIVILANGFV